MRKLFSVAVLLFALHSIVNAQLLTWAPDFAKDNDNITITMDATKGNQGLLGYSGNVYVHIGLITSASTNEGDWKYVLFTWGTTPANGQAAPAGTNKWSYTINNIRSFFNVTNGSEVIKAIAILFRDASGNLVQRNADVSVYNGNMYVPVYDNGLSVRFDLPPYQPYYHRIPETITKSIGDNIALTAVASQSSTMKLFLNGTEIQSASAATSISANPVLTTGGNQMIIAEADNGSSVKRDTLQFFIGITPPVLPLPSGVRDGINYEQGDTSVILVLYAPGKNRVSVIGEFPGSNWMEQNNYVMNKTPDGNRWWLRITGLTPGTEYGFQYLVDGILKVGEPYCEKVLDPWNDGFITSVTYPNLKPYPTGSTSGIVSVLQTAAPAYSWAINSFNRPDKRNLVIYELLLRDYLAAHDWKTLKDTLNYLKNLGINAIEIMPFNEFEGNESWGYNPDFFFAPDKYYGPKNSLKEFVDSCHSKGIAVIMDIVLNHTTGLNPLAALYWNSATNQPAANNPWLNVTATHPYSVFNDFNHESAATKYFSGRILGHWLQEYKLDGYRFDLSKGLTQNTQCGASQTNEACIAQYHADRVAILKGYYDTCQAKSAGSYLILEHFADNTEESELSDYGMMLWGNANYNFSEASMGWVNTSNFESYLHTVRGWSKPHLVGYMESHDEERMMYRNLNFGNTSNPSHNTRDLNTALTRIELCASFFLSAPGPKMIWEFGEMGYDQSINRCENGTIDNNCRLDKKPILWSYLQVSQRKTLHDVFSKMNKLRFHPWYKDLFIANNISLTRNLSGGIKNMIIRSASDSSMLVVIGNFDVNVQSTTITFPSAGVWYDYFKDVTFSATGSAQNITLQPGEYRVYLNRNVNNIAVTPVLDLPGQEDKLLAVVYPNPVNEGSVLEINMPGTGKADISLINSAGQPVQRIFSGTLTKGNHIMELSDKIRHLPAGTYIIKIQTSNAIRSVKLMIQ